MEWKLIAIRSNGGQQLIVHFRLLGCLDAGSDLDAGICLTISKINGNWRADERHLAE